MILCWLVCGVLMCVDVVSLMNDCVMGVLNVVFVLIVVVICLCFTMLMLVMV